MKFNSAFFIYLFIYPFEVKRPPAKCVFEERTFLCEDETSRILKGTKMEMKKEISFFFYYSCCVTLKELRNVNFIYSIWFNLILYFYPWKISISLLDFFCFLVAVFCCCTFLNKCILSMATLTTFVEKKKTKRKQVGSILILGII